MRILYVEDHPVFPGIVVPKFLSEHEVTVVPSLKEARGLLASAEFDVVLVDYDLEDGKGDTLVRELRLSGNQVWVVAVSSHDEGNQSLLAAGADVTCPKMTFDRIAQALAPDS